MKINVKFIAVHEDAVLPKRNHEGELDGDSGYDLTSIEDIIVPAGGSAIVNIGLKLANIEPGYWFKIEARSGLGFKSGIQPHPGIIDNGYRGSCGVKLYNFSNKDFELKKGDRAAQIVFYPLISAKIEFTTEAAESTRGEKGFGSSDVKK